ncbi:MAG: tRNA (guanosine(37)-N1)-methyltransferase TrmD [Lactobacillaceae bacterium]|jgi:tRNA (guanine37-N1)-methyltransferase|nr:tRNA (guanosine(37)-N1)-methyltransferase TrmD [Lactobacillaceae bacterium]
MKIDVLSIFPNIFTPLQESIVGKATERGLLDFNVVDFREFSTNKHHNVDDTVYGGGAGMLLTAQPIFDAIDSVKTPNSHVVLLDPAGRTFTNKVAQELSQKEHLIFIAGHYEGYDERIKTLVDDEISLGDYVLTGGELGAMVVIDATVRFLPGVLGNDDSADGDSFEDGLLEYPQYTKPAVFREMEVPEVLTSGNHELIRKWRLKESLRKTLLRRPDLLEGRNFTKEELQMLDEIQFEEDNRR